MRVVTDCFSTFTSLDAVQTAMDLENKTYDFYESQGRNATCDAERGFYETLAAEEREHHLILLDYCEYLKDLAGWFVRKEHPFLTTILISTPTFVNIPRPHFLTKCAMHIA